MNKGITLGKYYSVDSVIHNLDPRTKMFVTASYISSLFIIRNPLIYAGMFLIILIEYKRARVPLGFLLRGLRGVVLLLVFTVIFRSMITSGSVFLDIGYAEFTWEGMKKGVLLASRIALMIASAALLSYTATPKELADGIEAAFSRVNPRVVRDLSIMIMLAFRFIPVMIEEAQFLMEAQTARGAAFKNCSIFERIRNMVSLVVPLFLLMLKRSEELATAMDSRGYNEKGISSHMYPLVLKRRDKVIIFVSAIIVILQILGRIYL